MGIESKSTIRTINPTTGRVEKIFEPMAPAEVDQILRDADIAFQSWKKRSIKERSQIISRAADIMIERREELSKILTIEMGKLIEESRLEVDLGVSIFRYYADNAEALLEDTPLEPYSGKAFISYEPIGTILSVQPWNFPYYQLIRSAAPNLVGGNTMVLKHASNVPQSAKIMEEVLHQAGVPTGVYTNLFLAGSDVTALLDDPRIKAVALTGSEGAGSSIAEAAGKNIKKSVLELGGSDAFIVLDDVDVNEVAETAYYGRLWNAGQVCIAPKRFIVEESILPQFTEKLIELARKTRVGDPMDPLTNLAPLSSEKSRDEVLSQVNQAVEQGATLLYGGKKVDRPGAFMEPTILTNIKKGMNAYAEEIFGPVFCLYRVKDEDEAIKLANDSDFGLGGSVFSKDEKRAMSVARQIETGMVFINSITKALPEIPFGGSKRSGYGKEHGKEGLHEFLNKKLIRIE